MGRFTMHIEPIYASPKNHPVDKLRKLHTNLRKYFEGDLRRTLVKDMEETTQNWRTKPRMVGVITQPYGTRLQLVVFPKGRGATNWARISEGTGPRIIRARRAAKMRFQRGYNKKTTPGGGPYGGSGRRFGEWVSAETVNHRIAPRKFTTHIIRKRAPKIHRDVTKIVRKLKIKSGSI